ncbi:MAG: TRAP transporter large permease [Proteobacteria bacterium]|nr:TRAP transporter large permease [Pseudomonadota bacterium]
MELIFLVAAFLGALALSLDIALAMFFASAALLLIGDTVPLHLISEKAVSQIRLFPLLAIPGFIIAGELMNSTGLTEALGELARKLVGRWRGGMGLATVVACMFFGGMTGSGLAETVAIGTLMIPMLAKHGYPRAFSAAIVASGGSLGPIIPPSIPMVIYASIAPTVSVAALFLGGVLPGILIGLSFMTVVLIRTRQLGIEERARADDAPAAWGHILMRAGPALLVPVIVLYGTLGGLVTVTEASVLAAVYVFLYGLASRTLNLGSVWAAAASTTTSTGTFGFIIAAAGPFAFFLALFQAPQVIGQFLLSATGGSPTTLMLVLTVVLLVLGCLVEATSLVIILAPILSGTATIAGINQLHMALVSITALMIGLFTPPVGTNLFAVTSISGEPIERVSRESVPFAVAAGVVVLALAVLPELTTYVPRLFGK